jgi:phenylpropionate dioxygenase-like ring-hydroxylating dioxygenase large terminal subunit
MSSESIVARANELDVEGEALIYRSLRNFWHVVAFSTELTDKPFGFTLLGQEIVVARMDRKVVAFEDLCAHRGTKLSLGQVLEGCELECPYHGWRYNSDGELTLAPQRPDLAAHLRAHVKKYLAEERFGMVWVCLVDEPHFPLPEFPQWDDTSHKHLPIPANDWKCSAPRRVENYCDFAHLAIVHDKILGDRDHPEVPAHQVFRQGSKLMCVLDEGGKVVITSDDPDVSGSEAVDVGYVTSHHVFMPLTVVLEMVFNSGDSYYAMLHPTPIGPKETRNFNLVTARFADPGEEAAFIEKTAIINEQDRPVVESQRPEELPEDLSEEMHLKAVDTFSVDYRRWLLELSKELAPTHELVVSEVDALPACEAAR